jgi:hypothetical protein
MPLIVTLTIKRARACLCGLRARICAMVFSSGISWLNPVVAVQPT